MADLPHHELEQWARRFGADAVVRDFCSGSRVGDPNVLWPSWRWNSARGPFDDGGGLTSLRVQHVGPLIDHRMRSYESPGFAGPLTLGESDAPLIDIAEQGGYPNSELGDLIAQRFLAGVMTLPRGIAPPSLQPPDSLSPIALTSLGARRSTERRRGIALVGTADEPRDAVAFWNLRAAGHDIRVCPADVSGQRLMMLGNWLHLGAASRGTRPDPFVIWRRTDAALPEALLRSLEELDLEIVERPLSSSDPGSLLEDIGPLETSLRKRFEVDLSDPPREREVEVPSWVPLSRADDAGQVAVEFAVEPSDRGQHALVPAVPCAPGLAMAYGEWALGIGSPVLRPGSSGPVVAVSSWRDSVPFPVLPVDDVLRALCDPAEFSVTASDAGRFTEQIASTAGGISGGIANQPGARAVLRRLSLSPEGAPRQRVTQEAERSGGDWHRGPFTGEPLDGYGNFVLTKLLDSQLVVPQVQLACPMCKNLSLWDLETLARELTCRLCGRSFRAGVALMTSPGTDGQRWRYRLASHLSYDRLSGALASVATAAVIEQLCHLTSRGGDVRQFGVEFRRGGRAIYEIDYLRLCNFYDVPTAFIAEVKLGGSAAAEKADGSRLGEDQLSALTDVQTMLRGRGLECVVVASTMAEALDDEEASTIRRLVDRSPRRLYGPPDELCLPIILTRAQLDARPEAYGLLPWADDLGEVAQRSIELNLGRKAR